MYISRKKATNENVLITTKYMLRENADRLRENFLLSTTDINFEKSKIKHQ